jgi:hypothetical protein
MNESRLRSSCSGACVALIAAFLAPTGVWAAEPSRLTWETATPESQGMSSTDLDAL